MTITIGEVRVSLADAVTNGTGLRCAPYLVDQVNAPCAMVDRRAMDPRMVLGASKNLYPLRVTVFVSAQSEIAGQKALDEYCATSGTGSVKTAIENGELWAAAVDYASVTSIGDTTSREMAGIVYLAVDFDVEVVW